MTDLYEVLQVHPKAEPDVIRAAYRILARKYHPDLGGDQHRMIALNDAWDVLGDPDRRAEYDAARAVASAQAQAQAAPAASAAQAAPAAAASSPATAASATAATGYSGPASPASSGETIYGNPPASSAASGSSWEGPADGPRAGPPPGRPSGTVLDFGRYAGWSLGEVARYDRDYLEWLSRAIFARRLRTEIETLLRGGTGAGTRAGARR